MRIHFVDHCARLSGAQISLLTLVEDLIRRGHPCAVSLAEGGPLVAELERVGAQVQVFPELGIAPGIWPFGYPHRALRASLAVLAHVRSFRADVVTINSSKALITLGPFVRVGSAAPLVWAVRDIVGGDHFTRGQAALLRLQASLWPRAVVGNSSAALRSIRKRGSRSRHVVIYPGVGDVSVRPSVPHTGPVRLVMVGRLAEWKGQRLLVDAVAAMERGSDVSLDIVGSSMFGEDAYDAELRRAVADSPYDIRLIGFVPDPGSWLHKYDVLVHASTKPEAFGRVIVEGMKAGLAIVAAADGGPAEFVHDGVDGILIPEVSTAALAAALDRLVADTPSRRRLGSAARATAELFTRDRQVESYLDLYASLLRGGTGIESSEPGPRPAITVVVPSYRRPDSLSRTLASLRRLDEAPLETVVVARLEDTATLEVAAGAGVRVALTGPGGLAQAMQVGAEAARGDVVAFTDDDAEPLPDWTSRIGDAYASDNGLGAFGGRDLVVGDRDPGLPSSRVGVISVFGRVHGGHHRGVGPATSAHHLKGVNMTVRRSVFDSITLHDLVAGRGAQAGNELFVCLCAAKAGWRVRYDPQLQVLHHAAPRIDGTSRSPVDAGQARQDSCNVALSSMLFARGVRRFTVPLYVALVGERVRPGVAASVVLALRSRDPRQLTNALSGAAGVADAVVRWRRHTRYR